MSNRSRLMTLSGVLGVMFTITPNTLAQEPFSGCGVLIEDLPNCFAFIPDSGEFEFAFRLDNIGEFGHLDHVYVSTINVQPCSHICGAVECIFDNTIELCPVCGDGLIGGSELCDDTNLEDGDGCSSTCTVEDRFECTGEPSVCAIPPIPAVSQWGLCVMALLLMIAGTFSLRRRVRLLACFLVLLVTVSSYAQKPDLDAPHHPEHLLVRFKPNTSEQQKTNVHNEMVATRLMSYKLVDGLTLVKVPSSACC